MSAMKTVTLILAMTTLAACDIGGNDTFDPAHCDYEQAHTAQPAVVPADRTEWVDYDADGVVVLCMWTGVAA